MSYRTEAFTSKRCFWNALTLPTWFCSQTIESWQSLWLPYGISHRHIGIDFTRKYRYQHADSWVSVWSYQLSQQIQTEVSVTTHDGFGGAINNPESLARQAQMPLQLWCLHSDHVSHLWHDTVILNGVINTSFPSFFFLSVVLKNWKIEQKKAASWILNFRACDGHLFHNARGRCNTIRTWI